MTDDFTPSGGDPQSQPPDAFVDGRPAEQIAVLCKSTGMKVYYDGFERSSMWGKDLPSHLDTICQKNAHYCIVLISEAYARKPWTRLEIRSALARAMENPGLRVLASGPH
jgi:hypothetical protein